MRCALLPLCTHPKQDLATPTKVSETAAARLRKRAQRERERTEQNRAGDELLVSFPWNHGTRAAAAGRPVATSRLGAGESDIGCPVCNASNGRACSCGAKFADATNTRALASFVNFVRRSSTPVFEEDSPEDQWRLVSTMAEVFASEDRPQPVSNSEWEPFVRFVTLASLSGRPDTLDCLKGSLVPAAINALEAAG